MAIPTDFRVKHGLVVTTTATILGTTQSISSTTGALIVSGGSALQGNVNIFGDATVGTSSKASLLTVNNTTTSAIDIRSNAGFVSPNSLNTITVRMLDSDILTFSGAAGQLFSISDSFTGTIFAVNDISGVPSIEVFDTGLVSLAEFVGNVGIGTTSTTAKLTVNGGTAISGITTVTNTTNATSTTTGALQVSGGVGIGKDVWIGGTLNVTGGINATVAGTISTATTISITNDTASATAQYISFVSGTATSPLGTTLKIDTSELVFVPSTGRLGIGNTSPASKLDVTGDARISGITTVTNITDASSTTTGALVVTGGAGIGGNLYVGGTIFGNLTGTATTSTMANRWTTARTLTLAGDLGGSATFDGSSNFTLTATIQADSVALGTDTTGIYVAQGATSGFGLSGSASTEGSTFTVTANSTSSNTTSTIVFRNASGNFSAGTITAQAALITNTTSATSTATGALVVTGGVGIGGNLYVGGEIVAERLTIQLTTITTTLVQTDDIIQTANTTNATSTTTGALIVAGGVGIGRDLHVGGTIFGNISGTLTGNAATVSTVQRTSSATHFLTFVETNNVSATAESVYTTSSFAVIPSSGNVGIGTTSPIYRLHVETTSQSVDGINVQNGSRFVTIRPNMGSGANNGITQAGDSGIIFSTGTVETGAFIIAPWSTATSGLRMTGAGNVGIGTSPPVGQTLRVGKNITGATNAYGIVSQATVMSDVTSAAYMFSSFPSTQATSWTLGSLRHYDASQGTITSTVTNQIGFYADSNLTSATNNYGFFSNVPFGTGRWNFYAAGFGENYASNRWLIGRTYSVSEALGIFFNSGTANSAGVYNDTTISSATTGSFTAFSSYPGTAAAAFTLPNLFHYRANQNTFGAGSTVTNQYGFVVDAALTGATNNFGFYSNIPGGTGRWNFYANGTATNYFAGSVGIGTTSPTSLLHVAGNTLITGITTVTNTTSATSTVTGALQVVGGVGISGDLHVFRTINVGAIGGTPTTGINLNNNDLIGVNQIVFADPGPSEGISFAGNFQIYESPDDLVTNSGGNLQFVSNSIRRVTINANGQVAITTTTNATSTTTGALVVAGGVGIGQDLRVGGTIFGNISGTLTGNAATVSTVQRTTNASHFLTFVDSDNPSAAAESIYTNPSIIVNPGTGSLGIGTTPVVTARLTVSQSYTTATAAESFPFHISGVYSVADTNLKQVIRSNYLSNHTTGTQANGINILALHGVSGVGGTTTDAVNYWSRMDNNTGTTVTNAFNILINNGAGTSGPVNQYGLYVASLTKGLSTNYAIYTAGTTPNYFGGNVGIGVVTPITKLDISGGLRVSDVTTVTNTTNATSTTTGALQVAGGAGIGGDVYLGSNLVLTTSSGASGVVSVGTNVSSGIVNLFPSLTTNSNLNIASASGLGTVTIGGPSATVRVGSNSGGTSLLIGAGNSAILDYYTNNGIPGSIAINMFPTMATGTLTIGSTSTGRVAVSFNQQSSSTTTGALVVTGGVGVGGNLYVGNTIHVGPGTSNSFQTYSETTISSTAATTISAASTSTFRSARYSVQITQGVEYQTADILAIHNNTTATFMEYGNISTGINILGRFNVLVSGGNMLLQVTMNSNSTATVKVNRFALGV